MCSCPASPTSFRPRRREVERLEALAAARFSEKNEPLKRIQPAVEAFGKANAEGRKFIDPLALPSMTVLGIVEEARRSALEALASKTAGVPVHLVAADFDPDPTAVALLASRANLVIVPSRHEGFGLVGWEAIGVGTPLIIGRHTGLATQLRHSLGMSAAGVHVLDLDGTQRDVDAIAGAILHVAKDFQRALTDAAEVRTLLTNQFGCTWSRTAETLLIGAGLTSSPSYTGSPTPAPNRSSLTSMASAMTRGHSSEGANRSQLRKKFGHRASCSTSSKARAARARPWACGMAVASAMTDPTFRPAPSTRNTSATISPSVRQLGGS